MIAVTSADRIAMLPNAADANPASQQERSGVPGYKVSIWYGLLAPAGVPQVVKDRLQGAISEIFGSPDKALVDQFAALEVIPSPVNTPEQFTEFLRNDFAFWKNLAADVGAKPK